MATAEFNRALLIAKAKAIQADVAGKTQLADSVATAADNYKVLSEQGVAVAGQLEAELDNFLGIDFKSILNTAIPIVSRIGILKKPIGKILDIVKKVDPIVSGIQDAKKILESAQQQQGDNFAGLPKPAAKNAVDLQFALKDVEHNFTAVESALIKLKSETEPFENFAGDPSQQNFAGDSSADPENEEQFLGILTGILGAVPTIIDVAKRIF